MEYTSYLSHVTQNVTHGETKSTNISSSFIARNGNMVNNCDPGILFHTCQIPVANDGSTDNTVSVVQQLMDTVNKNSSINFNICCCPEIQGNVLLLFMDVVICPILIQPHCSDH